MPAPSAGRRFKDAIYEQFARVAKALANPHRIELVDLLAQGPRTVLRGFEDCHAPKLFRHFVAGKATVRVAGSRVVVTYPRRAHHPILRQVPWSGLPTQLPACPGAKLELRFP